MTLGDQGSLLPATNLSKGRTEKVKKCFLFLFPHSDSLLIQPHPLETLRTAERIWRDDSYYIYIAYVLIYWISDIGYYIATPSSYIGGGFLLYGAAMLRLCYMCKYILEDDSYHLAPICSGHITCAHTLCG